MAKPLLFFTTATTLLLGVLLQTSVSFAQVNADYSALPPESERSDPPLVLLSMSRDHQYFFKAYNDYTDLDPENTADVDANGNPVIETTYKHSFDYFGYFDAYKCYQYSSGVFDPISETADKYCSGSQWSGNFLNWVSMTRMDIVRKIFYGGKRSTDTATETILERAHLPMDAHSFAKYYNGDDIDRLTPYNNVDTDGSGGDNDGFDDIDEGVTFCNTTFVGTGGASQDANEPPLLRVAIGNYQLWNSNERWQCTFSDERNNADNFNIPPSAPETFTINGVDVEIDSGIDANRRDPSSGDDFIVRVRTCEDGLVGRERCKRYPSGNLKPTGILQTYGDGGQINFGLMTGSYENNIQGGVLRKNILPFNNEVNVATDGRFVFTNTSESIVRTLDSLRIWGYRHSNGTYRGGGNFDDCTFQLNELPNGRCNSWGNPISEIYRESVRYIAGLSPDATFNANDATFIAGLRTANWQDPISQTNQCSDLNTILINASVSSYDDDETDIADVTGGLDGTSANASGNTTDDWTNTVGVLEGISNNVTEFFVGRNGLNNNEACTAKPIPLLSNALGLCPEAPTVNGSYSMAGIAYYAHNNDIRPDLDGNQTLNTFAISLATNVPTITVPLSSGGLVEILPAYRNLGSPADPGGGALVDFRIVEPHTRTGANTFTGKFYVSWEDSEQGGDYDQDMWGIIEYELDESGATEELTITTTAVGQSTSTPQLFGFVTNGTSQDGFHAFSGIRGVNYVDPTGVPGCTNCRALRRFGTLTPDGQKGPQSHTFSVQSSSARQLESPLYYAAKYGGFEESLADGEAITLTDEPDELQEWDAVNNNTGLAGSDGLPDNFFFVINPENLFNSLEASLNKILSQDRAASSSVASFAGSNGFQNIIVQGTYQELLRDETLREVEWTGELFSYFIDDFGLLREDSPNSGTPRKLDGYTVDRAFSFDTTGNVPQIQYWNIAVDANGVPELLPDGSIDRTPAAGPLMPVSSLNTLWDAGELLRNVPNQGLLQQRPYSTPFPANAGNVTGRSRHIITYIDQNSNGEVDTGEQIDFLDSEIDATNFGFFGVGTEQEASRIVNFIRGYEDTANTGFRNRTVTVDNQDRTFRLGDLVNSTPLVVAAPDDGYDVNFNDESYEAFREQYKDRRQVAYIGGNDGLLHAFNVGFRRNVESDDAEIELATNVTVALNTTEYLLTGNNGETAHPLGSELWAYAPYNLLPHLQWLTSNFYSHVFYVDGSPQSYDVKIFPDDAVHPGGWGTILVVGMRQGGGDFPINVNGQSRTLSSAYVVLDITDPERPPTVLAEITHPNLNLTTSLPDIFYDCGSSCTNSNEQDNFDGDWTLVFGSGPNSIRQFNTNETAKIFSYDLKTNDLEEHEVTGPNNAVVPNSFVGDVTTRDWDNGLLGFRNDDVVYFGTVGEKLDTDTPDPNDMVDTGAVYRYLPSFFTQQDQTRLLIDVDRPVIQAPLAINRGPIVSTTLEFTNVLSSWVYFGTGVFLTTDDKETTQQEAFYGVIEPVDENELAALNSTPVTSAVSDREDSELLTFGVVAEGTPLDVTNIEVLNNNDGSLGVNVATGDFRTPFSPAAGAENVDELAEYIIRNRTGWMRELPLGALDDDPSMRLADRAVPFVNNIFFSAFQPDSFERQDICVGGEGFSELFAVNLGTGVASVFEPLGTTNDVINVTVDLGDGVASAPLIFTSESLGSNKGGVIVQRQDGAIQPGLEEQNINSIEQSRSGWRQILQ